MSCLESTENSFSSYSLVREREWAHWMADLSTHSLRIWWEEFLWVCCFRVHSFWRICMRPFPTSLSMSCLPFHNWWEHLNNGCDHCSQPTWVQSFPASPDGPHHSHNEWRVEWYWSDHNLRHTSQASTLMNSLYSHLWKFNPWIKFSRYLKIIINVLTPNYSWEYPQQYYKLLYWWPKLNQRVRTQRCCCGSTLFPIKLKFNKLYKTI